MEKHEYEMALEEVQEKFLKVMEIARKDDRIDIGLYNQLVAIKWQISAAIIMADK